MNSRKVQQVSGGTYTVSLPREWAKAQAIEAGSVVDIHTHIDGLLVIQSPGHTADDSTMRAFIRVDHDGIARLEWTLRAAYSSGAGEVLIVAVDSFTRDQRRVVNRVASQLPGMLLEEATESRIQLKMLLNANEVSVWQSVRQLQFVTLSMHREATAALLEGRTADSVLNRDDDADRLFALVDRYFDRALVRLDEVDSLELTRTELFTARTIARELEHVADQAERIAMVTHKLDTLSNGQLVADIRPIAETARTIVEDASECIIEGHDVETAYEVLAARDDVLDEFNTLQQRLFEDETIPSRLVSATDNLRRTVEIGGNIAELRIRTAVRAGELCNEQPECTADSEATPDSE